MAPNGPNIALVNFIKNIAYLFWVTARNYGSPESKVTTCLFCENTPVPQIEKIWHRMDPYYPSSIFIENVAKLFWFTARIYGSAEPKITIRFFVKILLFHKWRKCGTEWIQNIPFQFILKI